MATERQSGSRPERSDGGGGPPPSVIEELISSPDRRELLGALAECDGPVPVDDLARRLADGEPDEVSRADRRRVRSEIYQDHLPKLTATGVVAFDSVLGTVELLSEDRLEARLDALELDSKDK